MGRIAATGTETVRGEAKSIPGSGRRWLPGIFAIAAFLIGNGFIFVNPPLKTPDEGAHFARAYQLSQLQPVRKQRHGIRGGFTPLGIVQLGNRFGRVSFQGASARRTLEARRIRLDADKTVFQYFPNLAEYPWLAYAPQAMGITVARLFCDSALEIMYCGREANLIAYVVLVYAALLWMPNRCCQLTLLLIALLPMSLHQAGSLSPDALVIAMAIWAATAVWRVTFLETPTAKTDLSALFISTICLSLTKIYCLLSLLVLMIPGKRLGSSRARAAVLGVMLFSNFAVFALWMSQFHGNPSIDLNPRVNPHLQEQYILHHLGRMLPLLDSTITQHGKEIVTSVIGTFGWNEIMLPMTPVILCYALLAISVVSCGGPRYWQGAMVAAATIMIAIAAMLMAYYVETRAVGDTVIDGFQGRYLIPVLPAIIFLGRANSEGNSRLERLTLVAAVLISAFSVIFLAQQLYPAFPASRFFYRFSGN